ncbi:hypothetical protein FPZ12_039085 [Amycolatopsis acidicola]|uniref:AAA family ATPase n=1 Tax=Amycolatopsis acidicola TaxID=2596893 RepID=A0A5N0UR65_9PSEU|nr:hypothetical protein [Amycolatopsis acidicola]KAA9151331.1 hypothetical protein FPZ12_039085 [Amycolatopsis acidicola]
MPEVVLIGGTSNTGKSTLAQEIAARLGYEYLSTDGLARHPGRPWRTPEREVPAHVAEHYGTLSIEDLIDSVLAHYQRLWPRVEELIVSRNRLVLEGSALWPPFVAGVIAPRVTAVWLAASEAVLQARVREAGRYAGATAAERHLMDRFLARTFRYQELMLGELAKLGLEPVTADRPGEALSAVLPLVGC